MKRKLLLSILKKLFEFYPLIRICIQKNKDEVFKFYLDLPFFLAFLVEVLAYIYLTNLIINLISSAVYNLVAYFLP